MSLSLFTDKAAGLELSESYCCFPFLFYSSQEREDPMTGQKISSWTSVLGATFKLWLQPIMGLPYWMSPVPKKGKQLLCAQTTDWAEGRSCAWHPLVLASGPSAPIKEPLDQRAA